MRLKKVMDLKSQGILGTSDDIDIDQRRVYAKVSCQSYLARMLKTHGWNKPSQKSLYAYYLALKRLRKYLRRTNDWGILY